MKRLLEVKHLSIQFPTYAGIVQAVRDVSFSLDYAETVAIVGESGCGKSVTARAVMGLTQRTMGVVASESEICFEGENILTYTEKEWQRYRGGKCGIIFQDAMTSLNPTMKVGKQIQESILNHKKVSRDAAKKESIRLLRAVGLANPEKRYHQYPHEFSGGMRQRTMIALALACQPQILIADEPTTALDVTTQAQILDLLKQLQKEMGMSIILITHDLGVVAGLVQRVLVMYGGKIVEQGLSEEIFFSPKHPYTYALLRSAPRIDLDCGQELIPIEGNPPLLIDPPQGCPFSARCKYCMKICKQQQPDVFSFGETHHAACWLYHPDAPKINFE